VTKSAQDLPYRWLGGHLCLDFTNTVAWSTLGATGGVAIPRLEYERLTTYSRLVDWSRHAGLLSDGEADFLLAEAERRPEEAELALDRALALRQTLHDIFRAVAHRWPVHAPALARLNAVLTAALARLQLAETSGSFRWEWRDAARTLDRVLWPVAQAAGDLLVSDEVGRLRECSGEPCGFLFLDQSRGGRRRWCDMAHCGNRAKARRHYARTRLERTGERRHSVADPPLT
jgi:predicted RNA-binding Zn ribbon-like protein